MTPTGILGTRMTISTETRVAGPFSGDDATTEFPFAFKTLDSSDVYVLRSNADGGDDILTEGSDYTAELNADQDASPGGTVTLASALATGSALVISTNAGLLQPDNILNQGGFLPATLNTALDRLTIYVQQLKRDVDRSVKASVSGGSQAPTVEEIQASTDNNRIYRMTRALAESAIATIGTDAIGKIAEVIVDETNGNVRTAYDIVDSGGGVPELDVAGRVAVDVAERVVAAVGKVYTLAALALQPRTDASGARTVYLDLGGRSGNFTWTVGDYSAEVAADTEQGVYVQADGVPASEGAWKRQSDQKTIEQFGDLSAADAFYTAGGKLNFDVGEKVVSSTIQKNVLTTWTGQNGERVADPGEGTVISLGFDGVMFQTTTPGGVNFGQYGGISRITVRGDLDQYPSATMYSNNASVRRQLFENMFFNEFVNGFSGGGGELYFNRVFGSRSKYCWNMTDLADSWFTECHGGSGPNANALTSGGAGCRIARGSNITWDKCRWQVQLGGLGADAISVLGLRVNQTIIDQNESHGLRLVDCEDVFITAPDIFDNGTTGTNAAGVLITARAFTFTADAGTDTLTTSSTHNWRTTKKVELTTTGTLPAGLSTGATYYVYRTGDDTLQLALDRPGAEAGGDIIDITDSGTGTHTIHAVVDGVTIVGGKIHDRSNGTAEQRQDRGILFGNGGGFIRNVTLTGVDLSQVQTPIEGAENVQGGFRIESCPGVTLVNEDVGDTTLASTTAADAETFRFDTAITANRAVYLPIAGKYEGMRRRLVRTSNATGSFTVRFRSLVTGVDTEVAALANPGEWADAQYSDAAGDWVIVAKGTL